MAEDKKSFVLYTDLIHTVEQLDDKKAGELFKHILKYVNDLDPKTDDLILKISFEPIKQQLKRDLIKYNNIAERNRENGKKGGRPSTKPKPTGLSGNPKKPKKADSDNGSDSVSGNETVIDIPKKNKSKKEHLFTQSEFINMDLFTKKIQEDEKYLCFDFKYYHEAVLQWSNQGNKKKDWIATAKGFMLRDQKPRLNEQFKNVPNDKWDEWARGL